MIEIKVMFPSYEVAITALAAMRQATGSEVVAPKPEAKDNGKPAKAVKPEKAAAETPPTAAAAQTAASPTPPTESPSPGTSSAKAGRTREEMGAAIQAAVKTHRQVVVDTLGKHGAKAGKDIKDEGIGAFLTDLEAALSAADLS